jgi:hypothetical protein
MKGGTTTKGRRKSPDGIATDNLIFSAYTANNADVTYGQGAFWKNVDKNRYAIYPSDIKQELLAGIYPFLVFRKKENVIPLEVLSRETIRRIV